MIFLWPKYPKGEGDFQTLFGGRGGGGPYDQTWGWGMNFTDNGGATLFHIIFILFLEGGHCHKYFVLVTSMKVLNCCFN